MQEMIIRKMNAFIPYRSDVNYFLIYLENKNSTKVRDLILAEKGVLVRDCRYICGHGSKICSGCC